MEESLEEKLSREQDQLPWQELARHHAFGRLMIVKHPVDLLEAARAIAEDDAVRIKSWMDRDLFGPPKDCEALLYSDNKETEFKVNIISPFVVAKELN